MKKHNWKYDWVEVQNYYDSGHSIKECKVKFGFWKSAWQKAVKSGRIKARNRILPLSQLLVANRITNSHHLKRRLLEAGLLQNRCYGDDCGLTEWLGKSIVLQLDHINGDHADNRLENLRLLCPNCHSQTPTFGSRNFKNVKSRKISGATLVGGCNVPGSKSAYDVNR